MDEKVDVSSRAETENNHVMLLINLTFIST